MNITQAQIDSVQSTWQTVEEIHAWSGLLLHRANPTLRVVEADNLTEYVCQASIFTASDGSERLVLRVSLPLSEGYAEAGAKLWNSATAVSDVVIPAAYLS